MLGIGLPAACTLATTFRTGSWLDSTHGQVFGSLTWNRLHPLKVDLGGTLEHHDSAACSFPPDWR